MQKKYKKKDKSLFRFKDLTYRKEPIVRKERKDKLTHHKRSFHQKKKNSRRKFASNHYSSKGDDTKGKISETDTKVESKKPEQSRNEIDVNLLSPGNQRRNRENFLSEPKINNIQASRRDKQFSTPDINISEEKDLENSNDNGKTVRDLVISGSSKKYHNKKIQLTNSKKLLTSQIIEAPKVHHPDLTNKADQMVHMPTNKNTNKLNFYISDNNIRLSDVSVTVNDSHYDKLYKDEEVIQEMIGEETQIRSVFSENTTKNGGHGAMHGEADEENVNIDETIPASFEREKPVVDIVENNMRKTARKPQKGVEDEGSKPLEDYLKDGSLDKDIAFKNSGINISLIDKIKNSVANCSENKKNKIEKILHSQIQKFQSKKKSLSIKEKKEANKYANSLNNKIQEDNFYYLSELSYSLAVGAEVIEKAAKMGVEYIYEYDESGNENVIKINQPDKNEMIKKSVFFNHFHHCLQSIAYISTVEELSEDEFLHKKVYLPPKNNKHLKTLILDLDETLVHCTENLTKPFDFKTPIRFTGGEIIDFGVSIRPHAINFLKLLSNFFEIVIFTASHSCYANSILNLLDPYHEYITFRLFRESCIEIEDGIFVKDLRIFGNRNLDELMIVDNACYSYAFQLSNGIPIAPYFFGKNDNQLLELAGFLISLDSKSNQLAPIINKFESNNPISEILDSEDYMEEEPDPDEGSYSSFLNMTQRVTRKYVKVFKENFSRGAKGGLLREKLQWYFKGDVYRVFLENYGEKAPPLIAKYVINHTLGVENVE